MNDAEWDAGIDASSRMVGGLTTAGILMVFAYAVTAIGVLVVVLFAGMFARHSGYGGSIFLECVMAVILIGTMFVVPALIIWAAIKNRSENRAGYTTMLNVHRGLDHVDAESGMVIRVAGEPFLEPSEYKRRLALVRERMG